MNNLIHEIQCNELDIHSYNRGLSKCIERVRLGFYYYCVLEQLDITYILPWYGDDGCAF